MEALSSVMEDFTYAIASSEYPNLTLALVLTSILASGLLAIYFIVFRGSGGGGGEGMTVGDAAKATALQGKVVGMLLQAHRYAPNSLSDEKYFKKEGLITDGASNPFVEQDNDDIIAAQTKALLPNNLAIVIGVDSEKTPNVHDDCVKVKDLLEGSGYKVAMLTSKSYRPTSRNLAQVVRQVQEARRDWRNVVVYIAAPCRPSPVDWLDIREVMQQTLKLEATDRKSDVPLTASTRPTGFQSTAVQPPFRLEFMSDEDNAKDCQSWVDIGTLLKRLQVAAGVSRAPVNPPVLMLDVHFDASAVTDATSFMREVVKDDTKGLPSRVGAAPFDADERLRVPTALMEYLGDLSLNDAVCRLLDVNRLNCIAIGGARVTATQAGILKKSKVRAAQGTHSLFVRSLLEGHHHTAETAQGVDLSQLENMPSAASSLPVPVSTSTLENSAYHRTIMSPSSLVDFMRRRPLAGAGELDSKWQRSLFHLLHSVDRVADTNVDILSQSSLVPNSNPGSPLEDCFCPRTAIVEEAVTAVVSSSLMVGDEIPPAMSVVSLYGSRGTGRSTLARNVGWNASIIRHFTSGVVFMDMSDFAPLALSGSRPDGAKSTQDPAAPALAATGLGVLDKALSPDSVLVEFVGSLFQHIHTSVGGVGTADDARVALQRIVGGSNTFLVVDNVEWENPLQRAVLDALNSASGPRTSAAGVSTAVALLVASSKAPASLKNLGAGKSIEVPAMTAEEYTALLAVPGAMAPPDAANAAIDSISQNLTKADFPLWIAALIRGLRRAGVEWSTLKEMVDSDSKVTAVSLVHAAMERVGASIGTTAVEISKVLQVYGAYVLQTGTLGMPLAAFRLLTNRWEDQAVWMLLTQVGLLSSVESLRLRRSPLSRAFSNVVVANPAIFLAESITKPIADKEFGARATFGALLGYDQLLRPQPRFAFDTGLLGRDGNFAPLMMSLLGLSAGSARTSAWGTVNVFDAAKLKACFTQNLPFLIFTAARMPPRSWLALAKSAGVFDHEVIAAVEAYIVQGGDKNRHGFGGELLSSLYHRLPRETTVRKHLVGRLENAIAELVDAKKEDSSDTAEPASTSLPEREANEYPFSPIEFNGVAVRPVRYRTPLIQSQRNRSSADSDEETEEDADEATEGGLSLDEIDAMQPVFSDYALLNIAEDPTSMYAKVPKGAAAVSSMCYSDGKLFVGRTDGTLEVRNGDTDVVIASVKTTHDGPINALVSVPQFDDDDNVASFKVASCSRHNHKILLWDTELKENEVLEQLERPRPTPNPKTSVSVRWVPISVANFAPGFDADVRVSEALFAQRDADPKRFNAIVGSDSAVEQLMESNLRTKSRLSATYTSLCVSFGSLNDGDANDWNQQLVYGHYPEECVAAATLTVASAECPLAYTVAGEAADGSARIAAADASGRVTQFRLVNFALDERVKSSVQRSVPPVMSWTSGAKPRPAPEQQMPEPIVALPFFGKSAEANDK